MKTIENELIPVYENDKGNKLVDARELHEFLEVKTKFSDWIKDRIEKYDFVKDVDFTCISEKKEMQIGATVSTEYILTLDTAKEISMVQNNEKGKEARKYFIAVEKKYKKLNTSSFNPPQQIPILNTLNAVKFIADDLRIGNTGKIRMYRKACEDEGIKTNFLPAPKYKEEMSATDLLKEHNIPISVIKFNKLMLEHGFLEERKRPSTNKQGFKTFKILTDKGLKYGENESNTFGSSAQGQPVYYVDTFMELINFLGYSEGVM